MAGRPLGALLLEAIQNAFDAAGTLIEVQFSGGEIVIEDNAASGLHDERLVYTLFLSSKSNDPNKRGRLGRGLKEVIASMESATVETGGHTIDFSAAGRKSTKNERSAGTRVSLRRQFSEEELSDARRHVRMSLPPKGVTLRVDAKRVRRPKLLLSLTSELETVVVEGGVERATTRSATVSLYKPRKGEKPHLFEMGLPIAEWNGPWHVDIGQRVPLGPGRNQVHERYQLALKGALLDAMIGAYLDKNDLLDDWVQEVIARWPVRTSLLDAYVSKVFPRGAVLGGTSRANDRARQLGAHVIDTRSVSQGGQMALGRVLESADQYVRRRSAEFLGAEVEPTDEQIRFAASVRWLARRVAGRVVRVTFFERDPNDEGLLEDATTDIDARIISFNVRGPTRFNDILDPATMGLVLHELSHLDSAEHDHRFIDRLQHLAGQTARLLADGGPTLAAALRLGDPDDRAN